MAGSPFQDITEHIPLPTTLVRVYDKQGNRTDLVSAQTPESSPCPTMKTHQRAQRSVTIKMNGSVQTFRVC